MKDYEAVQISGASQEDLLLMVYRGALKYLITAKALMEKNQKIKAHGNIMKGISAVSYLIATLDHDKSPEIAGNLQKLYVYVIDKLTQALKNSSPSDIQVGINILDNLKKSWEEAFSAAAQGNESLAKTG